MEEQQKATTKDDSIGKLIAITANLTAPVQFNHVNMDYNQIMILVGANGTGKTFILKSTWLLGTIMMQCVELGKKNLPEDVIKGAAQYMTDNTFTDNNLDGTLGLTWEKGRIEILFTEGKITSLNHSIDAGVKTIPPHIFFSKDMRLFSQIKSYMQFKDIVTGSSRGDITPTFMEKAMKLYRIYDVLFVEGFLVKIDMINETKLDRLNKYVSGFDDKFGEIQHVWVDYPNCEIMYKTKDKDEAKFTTLGAGHQAMLLMGLGTAFQAN